MSQKTNSLFIGVALAVVLAGCSNVADTTMETISATSTSIDLPCYPPENLDCSVLDLTGVNLLAANLQYGNLRQANLTHADLQNANLSYANLQNANLSGVDLSGANLSGALMPDGTIHD